jgi:hypothetical protein
MKTTPAPLALQSVLQELFPNILFFQSVTDDRQAAGYEETDIYRFIQKKNIDINEKDTLVHEMIKNKAYAPLFPDDALSEWDELQETIRKGGCDILKYFIKRSDIDFVRGYNDNVRKEITIYDSPVTDLFHNELFKGKAFYLGKLHEAETFGMIIEHSAHSIYWAFRIYAQKQYALIRLGREFLLAEPHEQWKNDLLKMMNDTSDANNYRGLCIYYNDFMDDYERIYKTLKKRASDIESAWNIIQELFVKNLKTLQGLQKKDKKIKKLRLAISYNTITMINQMLETKPREYDTAYKPKDFFRLAGQISGQLGHAYQIDSNFDFEDGSNIFSDSEMQYIRKFCKEMYRIIDGEDGLQYEEKDIIQIKNCLERGTVSAKVKKLYGELQKPFVKAIFGDSANIIERLYNKISNVPLNETTDDEENTDIDPEDITGRGNNAREHLDRFAYNFLALEFKEDDEKDFIKFIVKHGDPETLWEECKLYYRDRLPRKSDSVLFKAYSGKRKNVSHQFFSHKIVKALNEYGIWFRKTYEKEGRHGEKT